MTLTAADRYTITLPNEAGTVTYVKGETLAPAHAALVPDADRDLFTTEPAAEAPKAAKAQATTTKS